MEKYIILGHNNPDVDSIVSGYLLEKLLTKKGYNVEFVIPDKKISDETLMICKQINLNPKNFQRDLNKIDQKFILVDHHEREIDGEIICIIDHHTELNNNILKPTYYYNKKSSSTSCLICQENEKYFNKEDIFLACIGAMVDTASFNSTKMQIKDKEWVLKMCHEYNLDYNQLYEIGLSLTKIDDLNEASLNGLKKYYFKDTTIYSSYIQIKDIINNENKIKRMIKFLQNYTLTNNLDMFVFIVHDMEALKSKVWKIKKDNIQIKCYQQYTSRGDKIIPDVINELKNTSN